MGPFEEEEEGTSIASDVVKVEGAESFHPRSPDLRNDTGTAISPISGQQNKATRIKTPHRPYILIVFPASQLTLQSPPRRLR